MFTSSSISYFSTMNSWISIPVCRAPPCNLTKISSPTLSEVTGIAVFCSSLSAASVSEGSATVRWTENRKNNIIQLKKPVTRVRKTSGGTNQGNCFRILYKDAVESLIIRISLKAKILPVSTIKFTNQQKYPTLTKRLIKFCERSCSRPLPLQGLAV